MTGVILFLLIAFTNCSKDADEPVLPTITLKNNTGYITENTTAAFGDTLLFGAIATGNGTDKLTNFKISVNNQVLLDSTINTDYYSFSFYTVKGPQEVEAWTISIKDKAGNVAEKTIVITGAFGEINSFTAVLLGAQDNVNDQSFLSLSNNLATRYNQSEAFNHQENIDLFCYYRNITGNEDMMSLASPGAVLSGIFTGSTSPENYSTKNTTYFNKTDLTAGNFDAVLNDAVILASFDENNKTSMATKLMVGDVYAFKLQSGKFGLFKVSQVSGETAGSITISIKVQK